MCGICGMVGKVDEELVKKMASVLKHRGPDSEGFYFDTEVGLGIRRLSIIDLITGDQPIHNEDKSIHLIYNGEIYNFLELRKSLEKKGHYFYTKTDTEVIVHLYEEYKQDCIKYLEGMFTFALWDKKEKKLLIGRDRIGIKPLYYTFNNREFIFASEMKAILIKKEISKEINFEAIDYFLTYLYIPEPITIFKNIYKLPSGYILIYQNGKITLEKYWDFEIKENNVYKKDYYERLYFLLMGTVKKHLISDVPIGVFLSGGIDSSTIVGLMSKLGVKPIKTFTIGYGKQDTSYNEFQYAKIVSNFFHTEHHEIIVKPEIVKILPKLVWHFDEPFADSSALVTFIVSQTASQHIKVALTGIGGDESFGGYPRYIGANLSIFYTKLPLIFRKIVASVVNNLHESTKSRDLVNWAKRFSKGCLFPPFLRYIYWISFIHQEEREKLYSPLFLTHIKKYDVYKIHNEYFEKFSNETFLEKIFYLDMKTYLTNDLLIMADKMSMANSLELRVPFCDHNLLEFCLSIPPEVKIENFNLKSLMKKTVSSLLPEEIIQKRKQGFMVPLGRWLKEDLKNLTLDLLSEKNIKKRGYFNSSYIKEILKQHYQGKSNFSDLLWALLNLEMWHQIFIDRNEF